MCVMEFPPRSRPSIDLRPNGPAFVLPLLNFMRYISYIEGHMDDASYITPKDWKVETRQYLTQQNLILEMVRTVVYLL